MMRARHQRSLIRSPSAWRSEGWLARLRWCCQRPRELEYPIPMTTTTSSVSDIELQELGRGDVNFVSAVVKSVAIEEEGLFRHIVTYI